MRRLALVMLVLGLVAACSGGEETKDEPNVTAKAEPAQAQPAASGGTAGVNEGVFARIPELVREVEPSIVAVEVPDGEGSGVIWSEDGIVVTNAHVVAGAREVNVVFANGVRADARVRATDRLTDLAVLEIDRKNAPAATFDEKLPRVGELAIAIGNPFGFEGSVTVGVVSGVHRSLPGERASESLVDLIQTDAAISPGNSGGALIDASGRVIGINVAYIPPEARAVSIGFAIPSSTVVDVVRELLEDGEAEHAFLGVRPAELTPQVVERFDVETETGVLVLSVVAESAAEKAGLAAGDVIVSIGNAPIRRVDELLAILRQRSPGDKLKMTVLREGERKELEVQLLDRPG